MLISWISWLWPCHWPGSGIMRLAHHHMASASASALAGCPPPWGRCSCWCTDTPWSPNMSPSSAHRQLSSEEGEIVKENVLDIFVFSNLSKLPDWAFTVARHNIKTSWRQRRKSRPASVSNTNIMCLLYFSFFSLRFKCDPDYCRETASFSKETEPFEFIPIPSSP